MAVVVVADEGGGARRAWGDKQCRLSRDRHAAGGRMLDQVWLDVQIISISAAAAPAAQGKVAG